MGYDMFIVQEADQAEEDAKATALAAAKAVPSPWRIPEGEEREAAEKAYTAAWDAYAKANRSYFRLNIFGMGRCCGVMDRLGMLTPEDTPSFPDLEGHGLTEWPERGEEGLSDAEKAFLAACDAVTDYEPQPVKGVPQGKFGTNDGWLVTPAQCSAAVATYRALPEETRAATEAEIEWWARWVAFLDYASGRGGFRVH